MWSLGSLEETVKTAGPKKVLMRRTNPKETKRAGGITLLSDLLFFLI